MWNVVSEYFWNAPAIHPMRQGDVAKMVNLCKYNNNIQKVIIFGSTVTAHCHSWSDIDIYFELSDNIGYLPVVKDSDVTFDKWTNFNVSPELYEEIIKTGVPVFQRGPY